MESFNSRYMASSRSVYVHTCAYVRVHTCAKGEKKEKEEEKKTEDWGGEVFLIHTMRKHVKCAGDHPAHPEE